MAGNGEFWNKRARKYAASPIRDPQAYQHTLDRTRSHLHPQMQVLELGCGTGSTALALAAAVRGYHGTDISSEMIKIAESKGCTSTALAFSTCDVTRALDCDPQPDAVLAFNLLHLIPDLDGLLVQIFDRLAPGGLFISKTPCLAEPSIGLRRFAFAALVPMLRGVGAAPFVRGLSFAQIEAGITRSGFDPIETGSFPAMSPFIVARKPNERT
jgi:predicted TPR repeat methyltransferase